MPRLVLEKDTVGAVFRFTEYEGIAGVRLSGIGLISSMKKESPMEAVAPVFGVAMSFMSLEVSTDMGGKSLCV